MINKINLSFIIVCIIFVVTAKCPAEMASDISQAQKNICTLMDSGNYDKAKVAVDKMVLDFSNSKDLPEAIYWTTRHYEWKGKYDEAKQLYHLIIERYPGNTFIKRAEIGILRSDILSLIWAKDYNNVQDEIHKLALDFVDNIDLPETYYYIGEAYEWSKRYEDAKILYQNTLDSNPSNLWENKAKLGLSRTNVLDFIVSGDFNRAKQAFDELIVNFSESPYLCETLFWIAEKYEWANRYEEAKNTYQQILSQKAVDNLWLNKAKLGFSRSETISLIRAKNYGPAKEVLDKMSIDFIENSDLPESLYWIAEKYMWAGEYKEAERVNRLIIQNHSASAYGEKARLRVLTAHTMALINAQDYNQAQIYFNKLNNQFSKHPDLPLSLYWVAERYEWAGGYEEAKRIYQQVIQKFPDSGYISKLKLNISRAEVLSLVTSKEYEKADEAFDKMVSDFKNNPELPIAIFVAGEKYFVEANAPDYKQKAILILEKAIYEIPYSNADNMQDVYVQLYCCAGDCYFQLSRFPEALACFEKIVNDYPPHRLTGRACFSIGQTCEELRKSGLISEQEAILKIRTAYERLVHEYPDYHPGFEIATNWLSEHE